MKAIWSALILVLPLSMPLVDAAELAVDLKSAKSGDEWILLDKTARIADGELVLDGRQKISRAIYQPLEWRDVELSAKFLVEPSSDGVLACGFIVRATDASTYYYIHFDRSQAILVRYSHSQEWHEIKRVGGLTKPAGAWHDAQLSVRGQTLKVSLNGKQILEAEDKTLTGGRIGFYGSQGLIRIKEIFVTGSATAATEEFKVPPPRHSIVCEDGGAGAYEAFPDVCRLKDGRLMCVFYAGYSHVSLPTEKYPRGGRIACCFSEDEGVNWSSAKTLYDGPLDDRDPSIVQLKDGRLLCNFFVLKPGAEGRAYDGQGSWVINSGDLGETWSTPQLLSKTHYTSSPIRELSDGRLIVGMYTEDATRSQGSVVFSDDGGTTWQPETMIDNNGVRLDAETDLIELKDGTLYAAQRDQMAYSRSRDRGKTWSVSQAMGFPGHCPYFLRTPNDEIILAFRLPNTSMRISRDECLTWSENIIIDEQIGAYPSLVNLRDGSVLVVYYEEGSGSNIRARRFRVTPKGVEWIRPNT